MMQDNNTGKDFLRACGLFLGIQLATAGAFGAAMSDAKEQPDDHRQTEETCTSIVGVSATSAMSKPSKEELLSLWEIEETLVRFAERNKAEWTETHSEWQKVYNTSGLRKIVADYTGNTGTHHLWTEAGGYLRVLEHMPCSWRERLAHPGVLDFVTKEKLHVRLLTDEPAVLLLLVERTRQEPDYKTKLWDLIEQSKSTDNKTVATAAANALTILNAAGVSFSGRDLRGINAPGAVLDGAVMDGTDLREANLEGAGLQGLRMKAIFDGKKCFYASLICHL